VPRSLADSFGTLTGLLRPGSSSLRASTWRPARHASRLLLSTRELEVCEVQRGWRRVTSGPVSRFPVPLPNPEEARWQGMITTLATTSSISLKPHADVLLSSELVRFAVVPWVDGMHGGDEQRAYVRHAFTQSFGLSGDHWDIRFSEQAWGRPYLATAVDVALLEATRAAFAGRAVRLGSIQPLFAWAWNRWSAQLADPDLWFAVVEPRRVCIARVASGLWEGVRSYRIAADWTRELPPLLARERLLSASAVNGGNVFVVTPGLDGQLVRGEWVAEELKLPLPVAELQEAV